jgi:REP element-mobilizing transposase RayT
MAKNRLSYKTDYRRNLPHIQPPGASLFITFRLVGSLPISVLYDLKAEAEAELLALCDLADPVERARQQYEAQKQYFGRWDAALDAEPTGPHWLKDPRVAHVVSSSMHHLNGRLYDLDSFCIMSNHVHVLFTPLRADYDAYHGLARIMHSLKGYTARQANELLVRSGQFWQRESYDHIVRDPDEFLRIRRYILHNPVKAGLVEQWSDWPYTYCTS